MSTLTSAARADALALVTDPELAWARGFHCRRAAWAILLTARGQRMAQRRLHLSLPAPLGGGDAA